VLIRRWVPWCGSNVKIHKRANLLMDKRVFATSKNT
jgi:hypothetical protein